MKKLILLLIGFILLSCSSDELRTEEECECVQSFYEIETTVVGGTLIRTDVFLYDIQIDCTDEIDRHFYSGYEFYNITCENND